jgi:hypothetical protein
MEADEWVVPALAACPASGCTAGWVRWGHYRRGVRLGRTEGRDVSDLRVVRIRCKGCGKTFGLLPSFRGAVQALLVVGHRRVRA